MLEKWFLKAVARLTAHKDKGPVGYASDTSGDFPPGHLHPSTFTHDLQYGDQAEHGPMRNYRPPLGRQGSQSDFLPNADENDRSGQIYGAKGVKSRGPVTYGVGDQGQPLQGKPATWGPSARGGDPDKP